MLKNQVAFRTMDEVGWAMVRPLVCQSCIRTLKSDGLALHDRQAVPEIVAGESLAVIIGFAGAQMRGTLILATTRDLLRRAPPYLGATVESAGRLMGWLGELCWGT